MDVDIEKLPDNAEALKAVIVDLQHHYEKEVDFLIEQIRLLRAQMYGKRSEKIVSEYRDAEVPLFDMPEPEDVPGKEITVSSHTRKKRGRRPLPEDLPRVERVHDISEEEKVCACGEKLVRIGEEVSEKLDIVPARIQVIRDIRPKYACRKCEGMESDAPAVRIAPPAPAILPKSIATPGLLAHILTAKFVDHMPFYRQEKQFERLGIELSRRNMCKWAIKVASACQPLLNLCKEEILEGYCINIDETVVQVLDEPGRDARTRSYMWIFQRGDPERPVLIYEYHPTRSGDVASRFLEDYRGYVQTDGYAGYDFLDMKSGVSHIGCWAHVRRKFHDIVKASGSNRKKAGSADAALGYIRKLYHLESVARKSMLGPEEIQRMREEQARPILSKFHDWLQKRSCHVPPKGLLGKAISYTLNQWDRLIGYVEDGRLSIDNNSAENAIRPFVIGRKNWLFAGTPEGAKASALLYSLIETAKANGLEPYSYLRHIFEKLPLSEKLADYEALLPWNLDPKNLNLPPVKEGV
jgi:transposase